MTKILANQTNTGSIVASGDITTSGGKLAVTTSSGDEGGEIFLNKSVTNTTITNGVTLDVFQNRLRFFEQGGSNRGFYLDITTGGNGAGTNLGNAVIADGSVTTTKIADGNVTNAKLANSSITVNGTSVSLGGSVTALTGVAYTSGNWYRAAFSVLAAPLAGTTGNTYYTPIIIPNSVTLDRIGMYCSKNGSARTLRLGIYSDNNGKPNTVLLDAGTISIGGAIAGVSITISHSLSAGLYWLAAKTTSGTSTTSEYSTAAVANELPNVGMFTNGLGPDIAGGYRETGTGTGVLANAGTVGISTDATPLVFVRVA